jgi:hypothetical protein
MQKLKSTPYNDLRPLPAARSARPGYKSRVDMCGRKASLDVSKLYAHEEGRFLPLVGVADE